MRRRLLRRAVLGLGLASLAILALLPSASAKVPEPVVAEAKVIDLSTVPKVRLYLRSLGIDPSGVVIQRGLKNYAGPHCPGPTWTCTTARRVVQLAPLAVGSANAGVNLFVCKPQGAGSNKATNTCVIIQPGGASNSATCDIQSAALAGQISQACFITQGGASNKAVAKLGAVLAGAGAEQDVTQRIEVRQTSSGSGNTLSASEIAVLGAAKRGGGAIVARQDFHQIICANQIATGGGGNTAAVNQHGASAVHLSNVGSAGIAQNTESLSQSCTNSPGAGPFVPLDTVVHDPLACAVAGGSGTPKLAANTCARIQQQSVTGRNKIDAQKQSNALLASVDRAPTAAIAQGSITGGIDSTQDQKSAGVSSIVDTQNATQVANVRNVPGSVAIAQIEDPRCCAGGHQLGNSANSWALQQDLQQRAVVNGVVVDPDQSPGVSQTGANFGNCTSAGNCTVDQQVTNNVETQSNSCSGSTCDAFVACEATGEGGTCTTEDDFEITNTATASSSTSDPNTGNNSATETTTVLASPPVPLSHHAAPLATTPGDQTPPPPPGTISPLDPIIDNGVVQLGINDAGHLNVPGGSPAFQSGTTVVGLRFLATNGEATGPGCLCEGWGIANADSSTGPFSGYANVSSDGGAVGLSVQTGTGTYGIDSSTDPASVGTNFRSITTAEGRIKVTHDYHPSTSPNLYEVLVTMENIGATAIGAVRYRRVMDWDIPPTTFWEWNEIHVGTSSALVRATTDGFRSANPLATPGPTVGSPPTTLVLGSPDYFGGPSDQGSTFDFAFGALAPGQKTSFRIFYGAAETRTAALGVIASVGAEVYSLGMPSTSFDTDAPAAVLGPNAFIFAFAGVGGEPVGDISLSPLAAENEVGQDHTVTATLDDDGTPIAGKQVTFKVVAGPNEGVEGTDTSDENGNATFTYTSEVTGTDQIEASFVDDNENTHTSNRVEKTWVEVAAADLAISMSDSPDPVDAGQELTYTITVHNGGPDAAENVTVTDAFTELVAFVSASASQGACSGTATVSCNLGTLGSGDSATVTIRVTP